jgi:hypothetical protein
MGMNYGFVFVRIGEHAGKVDYYDDDKSELHAIVYFGTPFKSEFAVIKKNALCPISSAEAIRLGWRGGRVE